MNVYTVLSEQLVAHHYTAPPEPWNIFATVVARNRSQARYLAWKDSGDDSYPDMRDMPSMSCKKILEGVEGPPRIVTDELCLECLCWDCQGGCRCWICGDETGLKGGPKDCLRCSKSPDCRCGSRIGWKRQEAGLTDCEMCELMSKGEFES